MELWKLGLEGKHDPFQSDGGLFIRWGISKNRLKTKGTLGELKGNGGYLGSAGNFLLKFSVWHLKSHKDKSTFQIIFLLKLPAPSIGVHFYKHL